MEERWIINKFGLFNFWYYDDEEFDLSDGKIIFRGTNGSGKSVTTQSFIPLLLDGDTRPERIDAFGSNARKIENYLLTGDDEERISYLYMEFKKEKSNTYITIGMGFKAKRGKGTEKWYFILKDGRRVNIDFKLYKYAGEKLPLTSKQLKNALGEGNIFTTDQKEYMENVNENFYGYADMEEYEDLLELLIQIRSPKLSKDFKPTVVYDILKESLSTLCDDDLRNIAEAMDSMDSINMKLLNLNKIIESGVNIRDSFSRYNKSVMVSKVKMYNERNEKIKRLNECIKIMRDGNDVKKDILSKKVFELVSLKDDLYKAKIKEKTFRGNKGFALNNEMFDLEVQEKEERKNIAVKEKMYGEKQKYKENIEKEYKSREEDIKKLKYKYDELLRSEKSLRTDIYFQPERDLEVILDSYEEEIPNEILNDIDGYDSIIRNNYKILFKYNKAFYELSNLEEAFENKKLDVKSAENKFTEAIKYLTNVKNEYIEKINMYIDKCTILKFKENDLVTLFKTVNKIQSVSECAEIFKIVQKTEYEIMKRMLEEKLKEEEKLRILEENMLCDDSEKECALTSYNEENINLVTIKNSDKDYEEEITCVKSNLDSYEEKMKKLKDEIDLFPKTTDIETGIKLIDENYNILSKEKVMILSLEEKNLKMKKIYDDLKLDIFEASEYINIPKDINEYERVIKNLSDYKRLVSECIILHSKIVSLKNINNKLRDMEQAIISDMDNIYSDILKFKDNIKRIQIETKSLNDVMKTLDMDKIENEYRHVVEIINSYPERIERCQIEKVRLEEVIKKENEEILKLDENIRRQYDLLRINKELILNEIRLGYENTHDIKDEEEIFDNVISKYRNVSINENTIKELYESLSKYGVDLEEYNLVSEDIFNHCEESDKEKKNLYDKGKRVDIRFKVNNKSMSIYSFIDYLKLIQRKQQNLISNKEKEIFEDVLVSTLITKIYAKIHKAESWVKLINDFMSKMDTSNGLRFGIKWIPKRAENENEMDIRHLIDLLKEDKIMTEEEKKNIADHFKEKLACEKRKSEKYYNYKSYISIIKDVLDYREWFEFRLFFKKPEEKLKELTDNEFFKLSGGEKAMAMYVPLFAAVNARYNCAGNKECPRVIALDEAFAGVDEENIGSMFELIENLDLDYILNSQFLWGTYESVKSLAIYELLRKGNDLIVPIRYTWDGNVKNLEI